MNRKLAIWKRKLAKEECKLKQKMWDRLKYIKPEHKPLNDFTFKSTYMDTFYDPEIEDQFAKMISETIDDEILKTLQDSIGKEDE